MWNSLPCTPADGTSATIKAFKCASRLRFLFQWSCLVHEIFRVFYVVVWAMRDGDIQNLSSFVPQSGASEDYCWKIMYLLSVRMNTAFHHLAVVLH